MKDAGIDLIIKAYIYSTHYREEETKQNIYEYLVINGWTPPIETMKQTMPINKKKTTE